MLANGDVDFAASRAYYGCFYVADALLSDKGLSLPTHAGVIGQYGLLFAKTERLGRRLHPLLNRSFRARQSADYALDFDLDDKEVGEIIVEGGAFLEAARDYLERKSAQESPGRK